MTDRPYLDSLGMWEATAALPEQLRESLAVAREAFAGSTALRSAGTPRAVAALGQGTGGSACEATAALATPHLRVPFWVGRGPTLPAFVDGETLVLAVSCDEGTDVPAAAHEALASGAHVVAVGSDPTLARLAADAGIPWCPVSPGGPAARAAARRGDGAPPGRARGGRPAPRPGAVRGRSRDGAGGQDATRTSPRGEPRRRWPAASGAPSPSCTGPTGSPPWPPVGGRPR